MSTDKIRKITMKKIIIMMVLFFTTSIFGAVSYTPYDPGAFHIGDFDASIDVNTMIFEGSSIDGNETAVSATNPTADRVIVLPDASGTVLLTGRTAQQFTQSIAGSKLGSAGAGWVLDAADDLLLATLPAEQTSEIIIVPITVPLKVGSIITGFSINGQIESAGGAVTVDASINKMTAAAGDFTTASIGAIAQVAKTADYKIIDANSAITAETVAADETFFVKITGTTAATTDVAIGGITITVTEP